jgi:broad specificity phosphatase PhoE
MSMRPAGGPAVGAGRCGPRPRPQATFLQIAEHCNREQFDALIGPYPGIVVSDRWNGFSHLDPQRRQVCWSHIQRDFRRHADGLGEQKTFGEQGQELTGRVFAAWRAYQREHHDRDRLKSEIAQVQSELRALLEDASPKSRRTRWHRRFANNLLKGLARALDLHHHRRDRADQQPRRTCAPLISHPPKSLARHPKQGR